MESSNLRAVFIPGLDPSGRRVQPVKGRLSCPHCGDLFQNPVDGFFNTWAPSQIRTLAAKKTPLGCSQCGKTSIGAVEPPVDAHGLEVIPPHELPNQMRVCYRGVLTLKEAQEKLGSQYRVLELCPAQSLANETGSELAPATEVIFCRSQGACDA